MDDTVEALEVILGPWTRTDAEHDREDADLFRQPDNPFVLDEKAFIHPYHASRHVNSMHHEIRLRDAVGKIAAESVELYPPGIPVIVEGFRVKQEAVDYLIKIRNTLLNMQRPAGTIVARDTKLKTLWVL